MFSRKGSMDEMEAAKLASLKHYLSRELSSSIKKLQKDHISSDSAIRSGEIANRICNLIEAVLLHHLKESYSSKTPWPFLMKFTHKDVISQLKGLTQVNTEIGYCRAWVRLALNDGLMDSYMDAMLSDVKVIQSHYKRTSFLRDPEEPHIMKNYLQGLVNFTFQLSFNSSLLNVWGAAPMILAGSWESPRERTQSNPNTSKRIVTGGPPLGIHQGDRTTQDLLVTKTKGDGTHPPRDRGLSFEESFHECEISSTLLRSPSEDGSTLLRMGGLTVSTDADPTTPENGGGLPASDKDLPEIRQDSYEDSIVIHMVSESPANHTDSKVESDRVETVYQAADDSKAKEFEVNMEERQTERKEKPSELNVKQDVSGREPVNPFSILETNLHIPCQTDIYDAKENATPNPETPHDDHQTGTQEGAVEAVQPPADVAKGSPDEGGNEEDPQHVHGNSLGAMSGWSSEFQNQLSPDTPSQESVPPDASKTLSYKTMLQQYSLQGPQPPTSFPEALDQRTDNHQAPPIEGALTSRARSPSDLDDLPSDFERTQSLLAMITEIGREKGLDKQNYQCKGCSRPVGIIYGKARVCSYDGNYYCYECHKDDEAVIPARILYNWDFRKHKVAVHTKLFLQQIEEMPLIEVKECNMSLYKASSELANVLRVRTQLKYLKAYLFTCKQSVAEGLRKRIWPREYMLDHVHLYSVMDFLQVQSGVLLHFLRKVIVFAAKHVQQCALCSQKGFICLICESPKIIYPFDTDLTVRCDTCKTVFHKACKSDVTPCPKCKRRLLRNQQLQASPQDLDFASPFT
ncbi:run domain Beclin-1-interacting and cysteine-rich domain-containing protein-like isoform X2 [Acanthaster planci]|uniref:Run domain Beclin-1-interacting and cysteine-rich domain-containing protein-like isoform X2 n=1 Tax=Acanthaster planci TaxID=133434 RepID=A0A8B7YAA0_ACAPL|nr:run domain Beclin-1-interacting and cysteine-rich domain-containing protein-like isoform X2 [Acanthaster planci]